MVKKQTRKQGTGQVNWKTAGPQFTVKQVLYHSRQRGCCAKKNQHLKSVVKFVADHMYKEKIYSDETKSCLATMTRGTDEHCMCR